MLTFRRMPTPLGEVTVVADDDWLTELHLPGDRGAVPDDAVEGGPTVDRAAQQLGEWFAGEREHFDLPLAPEELDGREELDASAPEPFAAQLVATGLPVLGGCCGTDEAHLRAVAALLA